MIQIQHGQILLKTQFENAYHEEGLAEWDR
jgi:hypothetical protein